MSEQQKLTVLLTGGSGVLGESLIDCLAEDFDLVCLARKSRIRHPRVEVLKGDICSPRLGLDVGDYEALLQACRLGDPRRCGDPHGWRISTRSFR